MNILNSLVQSSGFSSAKSAFDFLQGQSSSTVIPQQPILSSQYQLDFYIGNNQEPIRLFDIDNITKTLVTSEKKNFRPYGFTHKINLINYDGWSIKITGKKTDPSLNYLIQKVYESNSYSSYQSPNLAIPKQSILMPMFRMIETVSSNPDEYYNPRTVEMFEYENLVIDGYDEEVNGDNMPLTFTLSLFAKSRKSLVSQIDLDSLKQDDSGQIDQQIADLLTVLSKENKQIL